MDGVAGTIPEITPPSTQEIPIPDQISQELGGVQEGIAETIPEQDQQVIDLITQPEIPPFDPSTATQLDEIVITAPRETPIPEVQEGIDETIPEDVSFVETPIEPYVAPGSEFPPFDPATATMLEEIVITAPRDPLLGLSAPSVGEGEQEAINYQALEDLSSAEVGLGEQSAIDQANLDAIRDLSSFEVGQGEQDAIDRQALEGLSSAEVGLGEEQAIEQANLDALGDLSSAEVGLGEQEAIDRQALEELSSAEVGLGEQEAIDAITAQPEPTPYIRDTYISGGRRRQPTFGPTVTTLGQALAAPMFPSAPVSGLTSYRGAGEIEGQKTGKPRKNVWNEASLRLKDALGL
jgi:hypothetical protein